MPLRRRGRAARGRWRTRRARGGSAAGVCSGRATRKTRKRSRTQCQHSEITMFAPGSRSGLRQAAAPDLRRQTGRSGYQSGRFDTIVPPKAPGAAEPRCWSLAALVYTSGCGRGTRVTMAHRARRSSAVCERRCRGQFARAGRFFGVRRHWSSGIFRGPVGRCAFRNRAGCPGCTGVHRNDLFSVRFGWWRKSRRSGTAADGSDGRNRRGLGSTHKTSPSLRDSGN